ncbi:carbon-phosphorus lyase complex subunit PhnI [Halopenitus persicus]|uniref:Alpha-D-ribose 1-methylphosphonate 5-triphosphate synthase subunit PhnI n=1 Tax=Halopenitus persicus TaxID=1048396 RepID=A0A1H3LIB6_9EURY|nr:carbon-phosphorus lyase complex subunit PhnI [Halopenitus persicus]SDY64040.1 alpha-D-ribose 1-methylphosphonate 5-triphosphate synthase subunit PhnI [Halopenitus persicus]
MGYVAVSAGEDVIRRAEDLYEKTRIEGESDTVSVDQVADQFGRLTGQVMGESGLYAPRLAALAIKQAQGDAVEAAFLLRAYRSTLELWGYAEAPSTDALDVERRVSPAFKDVPGGQILGGTKDYTQRLLDFDLDGEDDPVNPIDAWDLDPEHDVDINDEEPGSLAGVVDLLREEELVADPETAAIDDHVEDGPQDTTREPLSHPAPRDAILQELSRGETGAVTALGYSALRGYGQVHPTLAEVRVGSLPLRVKHPYTGETATLPGTDVSECQGVVPAYETRDEARFAFGYGVTFGRNERKAIGMTMLDASIQLDGDAPAEDAEFVLDVVDGLDSFGFIEHLKLPHYVTFQSILDRVRSIQERDTTTDEKVDAELAEVGGDD